MDQNYVTEMEMSMTDQAILLMWKYPSIMNRIEYGSKMAEEQSYDAESTLSNFASRNSTES